MVYGNPYLPSQKNGWKARKRPQNDLGARFLFVLAVLGLMLGAWLISHPVPAKAKTIELKDCMTNKCICDLLLAGDWQGHTQESEVLRVCAKETI